jgi:hypothetical protein
VRDSFDFVETSQDPDLHGTTSTVTALPDFMAGTRQRAYCTTSTHT